MKVRLTLWFYGVFMHLLTPLVKWRLRQKGKTEPGYLLRIQERFGLYDCPASSAWLWIHAVSLGETRAAVILIERIRKTYPHMRLLLTHSTATGMLEGSKVLARGDLQVWQPWDTPKAVNRFLKHFQPSLGLLMETEIWPQLIHCARAQHIPVVLVNARMSPKSFLKASQLSYLSKPAFQALHFALAQHEQDAQLLRQLSCLVQEVVGNIKFDAHLNAEQIHWGERWRSKRERAMVMLASSRPGEELAFLEAIRTLTPHEQVSTLWAIVPRHPQRFTEVAQLIESKGMVCTMRSKAPSLEALVNTLQGQGEESLEVFLGDSLGEMNFYYASADLALLGGSFLPFGGQNLIESIACQSPILLGPHTFNFKEVAEQACASGAAKRVEDLRAALSQAMGLLEDRARLQEMQQAGTTFMAAHQGATERTFNAIEPLLRQCDQAQHP